MAEWTRRVGWRRGDPPDALVSREWLVCNGLGGYAAGTVGGVASRRFHAPLVAALPAPLGRVVALARLDDAVGVGDRTPARLTGIAPWMGPAALPADVVEEFALEDGLPVWRYVTDGVVLEKRLLLRHLRNTVQVRYQLLEAPSAVTLALRPWFNVRPHEGDVGALAGAVRHPSDGPAFPYDWLPTPGGLEVRSAHAPDVRMAVLGPREPSFLADVALVELRYAVEESRGYDFRGPIASPGRWEVRLGIDETVTVAASTEPWSELRAVTPEEAGVAETERRRGLVRLAAPALLDDLATELVWAADQFIITPHGRVGDEARQHAAGREARSVIAGYHWFTDWGRDTMIALEGLTLATGNVRDAASILRTFAAHVRDGLVPNYFPEGDAEPVYHTADASLWFVHALARYDALAGDPGVRQELMPVVGEIVRHHTDGTRFGIAMDPRDGLLRQGAPGYQLTWMDAKVGDWVVTPRRGKAVEINALWYHALRACEQWARTDGDLAGAQGLGERAARVQAAFNARFWNDADGWCHDVIDVEGHEGAVDPSLRPNQLFAIALPNPVLEPGRWPAVLRACRDRLLTPVGLRTLAPGHPDYRPRYDGDLRSRDAAYHQGTVWPWLLGALVDAWLRTHGPGAHALGWVREGLALHLSQGCLGQINEIMDAEAPYTPRGCVAQAWSVAETIRALAAIHRAEAGAAVTTPGPRDRGPEGAPARRRS